MITASVPSVNVSNRSREIPQVALKLYPAPNAFSITSGNTAAKDASRMKAVQMPPAIHAGLPAGEAVGPRHVRVRVHQLDRRGEDRDVRDLRGRYGHVGHDHEGRGGTALVQVDSDDHEDGRGDPRHHGHPHRRAEAPAEHPEPACERAVIARHGLDAVGPDHPDGAHRPYAEFCSGTGQFTPHVLRQGPHVPTQGALARATADSEHDTCGDVLQKLSAVRLVQHHTTARATGEGPWTAPVILEALIPGSMQSHASTAEVPRGTARARGQDGVRDP